MAVSRPSRAPAASRGSSQGQDPSSYQVEELHLAAMHFAAFALLSPAFFDCDRLDRVVASAERRNAAHNPASSRFAERAWRRPLEAGRSATARRRSGAPTSLPARSTRPIALTVAGILQAPAFHFRIERGAADDAGKPTPWELATRLSYFLWDSMPDDGAVRGGRGRRAGHAGGSVERAGAANAGTTRRRGPPSSTSTTSGSDTDRRAADRAVAPRLRARGSASTPEMETARDDDVRVADHPGTDPPLAEARDRTLRRAGPIFDGDGTFTALLTDHHGYLSDATVPQSTAPGVTRLRRPAGSDAADRIRSGVDRAQGAADALSRPSSRAASAPGC